MQAARTNLENAGPNYKGDYCKPAIAVRASIWSVARLAEVNAGIAFDRRHNHTRSLTAETLFFARPISRTCRTH